MPELALGEALLGEVEEEWRALAEASRNVFATPEFLGLWWRELGPGGEPRVTVARAGGEVRAIVPLHRRRVGPLRLLRLAGHGAGDELGPVAADPDTARAALEQVLAAGGFDVFVAEQVADGLVEGRELRREGSPLIRFAEGESWDAFLTGLSAKLRRDLRGDERKLSERHGLAFRLCDDPERLDADLDTLFALHRARWADSPFARRERFHRAFAHVAHERGWLRLWLLELDGAPAAAWYGFRFAGVDSHYQVGRDPAWGKVGVGTLLSGHTIREALADGIREYRFLRGDEPYKYRFAREDPGVRTVARTRGPAGAAALATGRLALRARRSLRRRR